MKSSDQIESKKLSAILMDLNQGISNAMIYFQSYRTLGVSGNIDSLYSHLTSTSEFTEELLQSKSRDYPLAFFIVAASILVLISVGFFSIKLRLKFQAYKNTAKTLSEIKQGILLSSKKILRKFRRILETFSKVF